MLMCRRLSSNLISLGNELMYLFQVICEVESPVFLISTCFPSMILAYKSPRWVSWIPSRVDDFSGFLGISNNTFTEYMEIYDGLKVDRNLVYNLIHCYHNSQTVLI